MTVRMKLSKDQVHERHAALSQLQGASPMPGFKLAERWRLLQLECADWVCHPSGHSVQHVTIEPLESRFQCNAVGPALVLVEISVLSLLRRILRTQSSQQPL